MGHIKDLPKSKLGIDIKHDFKPDYLPVAKRDEIIKTLKKIAKKAKVIYLATDPDREGEAIAYHVSEILNDKGTKILDKKSKHLVSSVESQISRITFHEITKEAVEEALASPREVDKNLVNAQIGRRVLDRLVGYKLSPLLWRKVRRGLSAGRVQSVTVRLIVEREREIEKFKSEEYWEIYSEVKSGKLKVKSFLIELIKIGNKVVEIHNKETADKILADLKKAKYKVLDVTKREVVKNPYAPFTTSTMTQAGARIFGWSAKKTMSTAQSLYEKGLITYHRTDSTNVAVSAIEKVRSFIKSEYGDKYLSETVKIYKTKSKVAQEAHEAIRPTDVNTNYKGEGKFSSYEEKLYSLIWKRFVASQMRASIYDETTIDVSALLHTTSYLLRASGQIMKFDGWRRVVPRSSESEVGSTELPEVVKNELLQLIKVDSYQKFTEPPARYNEASLIKTLEKLGIGRPSTYAPIISTIQVRQYVEKKEEKFFPTPVGVAVNDFLIRHFSDVFDYQFTAEMEEDLDEIANGEEKWTDPIKRFWTPFEKTLEIVEKGSKRVKIEVEKLGKKCPKCKEARLAGDKSRQGELVIRIGRFGKFISCSRFPDCDYSEKYLEKIGIKCPECRQGDVIIKKSKKGNFFGCSRYPECKWASWKRPILDKEKEEKIESPTTQKS